MESICLNMWASIFFLLGIQIKGDILSGILKGNHCGPPSYFGIILIFLNNYCNNNAIIYFYIVIQTVHSTSTPIQLTTAKSLLFMKNASSPVILQWACERTQGRYIPFFIDVEADSGILSNWDFTVSEVEHLIPIQIISSPKIFWPNIPYLNFI